MMGVMLSAAMYWAVHGAVVVCAAGQDQKENAMETERDEGEDLDESVPVLYTETEKNEINSSRLIFTAEIPDGFGLDAQLTVCHQESGNMYQVVAYAANDYYGYLYVPTGEYSIVSCAVCGDGTGKYSMNLPEGFLMLGNDFYTVESTLKDYDRIAEQIRRAKKSGDNGENVADESEGDKSVHKKALVLPWRQVGTEGICQSSVNFEGVSNGEYRIVIEITESGSLRDALYHYSLDGGENWGVELHMEKTAVELENTGLTISFDHDEGTEYYAGDKYLLSVEKEYAVTSTNSAPGTIYFHVDGVLEENLDVAVKMYGAGPAKGNAFYYSLDGGKIYSEVTLVPDSLVFQIPETNYRVTFVDVLGNYRENQTFFIKETITTQERDYTPVLMGMSMILLILGMAGYLYMRSLMDKDGDYRFQVYHPVEALAKETEGKAERKIEKKGQKKLGRERKREV